MDIATASVESSTVLEEIHGAVIASDLFLERILIGFIGRGHILIEDVPGTGKTLTARCVADALGLSFSRIQFTPDLLPADVTGSHVFRESERTFEFQEGPIFANIVLADEINRAPPKTQASLLEAMEEGQVTVDGETHQLPDPFFVIATQNPIEQEGTFPLPEAQIDRFLIKSSMGYPDETGEIELLQRRNDREEQSPSVVRVIEAADLRALRRVPEQVHVHADLVEYVVRLARATREDDRVRHGVSPRGTQRLFEAARAHATIAGRAYLTPDDVIKVAQPVLAHRLVLTPDAIINDVARADVIDDVLESVPVPTVE